MTKSTIFIYSHSGTELRARYEKADKKRPHRIASKACEMIFAYQVSRKEKQRIKWPVIT